MKLLDIAGKKFGKLTALESVKVEVNNKKKTQWRCICECGKETVTTSSRLVSGTTKSCGCIKGVCKTFTKDKFVERAKSVHGNAYDYSETIYVKSQAKAQILCKKCLTYFEMTPNEHLCGRGCKTCSRKGVADRLRHTTDDFVRKANEVHGDSKFNYSKVDYTGSKGKVVIGCNICGTEFLQTASAHLTGKGCKQCAVNAMADRCRDSKEDFIKKARNTHGDRYNYDKVEYKNATTDVVVHCYKHGDFTTRPNHHINGSGCEKCGKDRLSNLFMKSQEDYIKEAEQVHQGKGYDYSQVDYRGAKYKVTVHCPTHGFFDIHAQSHLTGIGCASCANWGFDFNLPATLYVLQDGSVTKVGITGRDVSKRLSEINNDSGKSFKILRTFSFDTGRKCYEVETSVLDTLSQKYESPNEKFDGYTECFYNVDSCRLFKDIEELLGDTE